MHNLTIIRDGKPGGLVGGSCCTIGNFDGVHQGHQRILQAITAAADQRNLSHRVVVTFFPHPLVVLGRVPSVRYLSTFHQRFALFERWGMTAVRLVRFTLDVAAMGAEEFFEKILIQQLDCRHLVLGPDTALGKDREGTIERLQEIAHRHSCTSEVVPCMMHVGSKISSRVIRDLVNEGAVEAAARLLGRPYSVESRVVKGDQRGRQLGFPTMNLMLTGRVPPRFGVYACVVTVGDDCYQAVANMGVRPTFGGSAPVLEAHLLGVNGVDLYRRRVEVHFIARLRDEMAFSGIDGLKQQIAHDCRAAIDCLSSGEGARWMAHISAHQSKSIAGG